MTGTTDKLKDELKETLEAVTSLRDEIRVQVHLAGMDAKERWAALEEDLHRVQAAAKEASEKSLHAVRDAMKEFQTSLKISR